MDTQQPSPSSLSDSTTDLQKLHEKLKKFGYERPEALAVLFVGPQEMIVGEVYDFEEYVKKMDPYITTTKCLSIFERGEFVAVKNPVRATRLTIPRQDGSIVFPVIFSEFDYVYEGVVEVKPVGAFFLEWLDEESQLRYCASIVDVMEGREKARAAAKAKAAGIVTAAPGDVKRIADSLKIPR